MNTFEQLIGQQIINIYRLDIREDYEPNLLLALFIQLVNSSGLLIGKDFDHGFTALNYTILDEVRDLFGTDWNETCLNELKPADPLNIFVGKTIQSIKVGQFKQDKFATKNFIITPGEFAGVIIKAGENKLTIYKKERMQELFINSEILFPNSDDWTLS